MEIFLLKTRLHNINVNAAQLLNRSNCFPARLAQSVEHQTLRPRIYLPRSIWWSWVRAPHWAFLFASTRSSSVQQLLFLCFHQRNLPTQGQERATRRSGSPRYWQPHSQNLLKPSAAVSACRTSSLCQHPSFSAAPLLCGKKIRKVASRHENGNQSYDLVGRDGIPKAAATLSRDRRPWHKPIAWRASA